MEEDLYERIGEADLNPTYKDGQVYQHTDINNMLSILKTAVNENYYDIQRILNGTKTVENANSIDGATLSRYLDETLQADDNKVPSSQQAKAYMDDLFAEYSPPIRGVDYWTEEDKEEIIDEAIEESQLKPKGDYDPTVQYSKLDIVFYENSSYVALQTTQGNLPTDTDYWQLLVSGELSVDDIVDNLDSNETTKPLSAKQGKELNKTKATIHNTVANMKVDTSLKTGMTVQTLGYYEVNDGGAATYKITNEESETEYQEELDNGLYATLMIEDTANIKQFGAKGDGETDDSSAFVKATSKFNNVYIPNGHYILKSPLTLKQSFIGENEKNTIIELKEFTEFPEFPIKNSSFSDSSNIQSIDVENITFIESRGYTDRVTRTFGIANTNYSTFKNLSFINDTNSRLSALDFYTNNKNLVVKNIYVRCKNTEYNCGMIRVREYTPYDVVNTPNIYTENVLIDNIYGELSGFDELLWIDAWHGKMRNITINNAKLYSYGSKRDNLIWIGINHQNCILENVNFTNSYAYIENCKSKMLISGLSQVTGTGSIIKNFNINNCIFEVGESSETTSRILDLGEFLDDNALKITNCKFINKGENKLAYFIKSSNSNKYISKNNNYKGKVTYGLLNGYSENDIFNLTGDLSRDTTYIKGATGTITGDIYNNYKTTNTKFVLDNCNISCRRVITDSGSLATSSTIYNITNSNMDFSSYLCVISSPTNLPTINLLNTNISKIPLTNGNTAVVNANGLTVGGVAPGSIPSDSHDRFLYNVGTRFISNTPTKSIIRKISAGDQTSDWEEV